MKRQIIVFAEALLLVLGMGLGSLASAQLAAFPGDKTLDSGPDPVGLGKSTSTTYEYTINLDTGFDNTKDVEDVVPAEFDVDNLSVSRFCTAPLANIGNACSVNADCDVVLGDGVCSDCGAAVSGEGPGSVKGNQPKLNPDIITWDLTGCDTSESRSLTVTTETDKNPGHQKRGIDFFEPTECGPLALNDGAVLIDPATGEPVTEPSNSLSVATCLLEGDANCVDADDDGWSLDCGDNCPDDANADQADADGDGEGDACDATPLGVCGDGLVLGTETCDDGGESATCDTDCTAVACGDGTLNATAGEGCDDGNTTDGDGCSSTCAIEP